MLVPPDSVAPPTTTTPLSFDPSCQPQTRTESSPPSLKKHKALPRPSADVVVGISPASSIASGFIIASNSKKEPVTPPRSTRGLPDTGVIGPDPPPTPPAHLRALSDSQQNLASTPIRTPLRSAIETGAVTPAPGTPTLQRSPPTPDVTPPQVGRRPKRFRSKSTDRIPSKGTTDSRTESFKTARESPGISDEERATPKPLISPARARQNSAGRRVDSNPWKPNNVVLALALDLGDTSTPWAKQDFFTFDGESVANSEVEQEWDDNLNRNVIVRKYQGHPRNTERAKMLEDVTVMPANISKALRPTRLHERKHAAPSPQLVSTNFGNKGKPRWPAPASESSTTTDMRRSSVMSARSTVSTVVEAILVDVPPQRQKTLRHVRKQATLRDSGSEFSPSSSTSNFVRQVDKTRYPIVPGKPTALRTNSMVSVSTVNSIASPQARRQVWKNGGIPVVVIPQRKESAKSTSSGPPSLRSRDSHHSKRSNSVGPESRRTQQTAKKASSSSDKPPRCRRGRPVSMIDGLPLNDDPTVGYPPTVPRRTSSLSAPTSRNASRAGSRTGSLTAESLKAHNALLLQQERILPFQVMMVEPALFTEDMSSQLEQKQLCPELSVESHKNEILNQRSPVDHNGDPFFGKRLTSYTTPFSQVSVETNGTHSAADIAEAMAVNIYSHQNKSVLMIHHVAKPGNLADDEQLNDSAQIDSLGDTRRISGNSEIIAIGLDVGSVTPAQPRLSVPDVDSPLLNQRAPPETPSVNFSAAAASGMTPALEKQKIMGSLSEENQDRPSLVRRAFSLRKNAGNITSLRSGFLARTMSLSRTIRRNTEDHLDLEKSEKQTLHRRSTTDDSKLQSTQTRNMDMDTNDFVYDVSETPHREDDSHLPTGKRLVPRRGSLSERVRRTFATIPIEDDNHYIRVDDQRGPERRTIKRTPSGNLRVVPHHGEPDDIHQSGVPLQEDGGRPSTAPEDFERRLWGPEKRVDDRGLRIFPGWQDKLGQYKPQSLQRRLSEHRRQKRTEALRQKIGEPYDVRDSFGDLMQRSSFTGPLQQDGSPIHDPAT